MKYRKTIIAVGAIAILAIVVHTIRSEPPDDAAMLATFTEKREIFETLKDRICALPHSQTVMMSPEWSRPEVDQATREGYHHLFAEIGARGIQSVRTEDGCGLTVDVWSVGIGGDGDYKGYDYRLRIHETDATWLDSLDAVDRASHEIAFYYRRIDDDWSLYFNHWP